MASLAGLFSGGPAPTFVEREPWERGFAQIFASDLAPQLAALETRRRLTLAGIAAAVAIDAVLIYLIAIIIAENPALRWEAKLLAGVAGLLLAACIWLVARFVRREQRVVLPVVCRQFGPLEVDIAPTAPTSALEPYWALSLIRKQRSGKALSLVVRDLVTGTYRDIGLRLVEFDATDGSPYDLQSMFRGAVLELALPDPGPGNSYASWHFDQAVLTRVAEGLPGEPPPAAATPVTEVGTPAVARALSRMAAAFGTDVLCGAASGSDIYIAIPRPRKRRPLGATPIWRSVYRCEPAIRAALAELAAVFAIVDAVADACGQPAAAALAAAPVAQTSAVTDADAAAVAGPAIPSSSGRPHGQSPATSQRIAVMALIAVVLVLGAATVSLILLSARMFEPHESTDEMVRVREAAEHGDAAAQNSLGIMYQNGWSVTQDYGEAMRWFRKAADRGLARAQYHIGNLYANGWGVPSDLSEARNWMQKAADGGEQDAKQWLAAQ